MTNEQLKIARAFDRFAGCGFKRSLFTKALHEHMHINFGFIAHFDRDGFYCARFDDPDGLVVTLNRIMRAEAYYFDESNPNHELNRHIRDTVRDAAPRILTQARDTKLASLRTTMAQCAREIKELTGVDCLVF